MDQRDAGTLPPYRRIVDEIRARIAAGSLRPGDRIPSARQITKHWGVAIATATKVLATLRHEGVVRAVPGVGTIVTGPGPAEGGLRNEAARPETSRPSGASRPARAEASASKQSIVRAAIAVADAEGLAAVSMRRVATQLDLATMSLYRHVRDKDDLFLQMANTVFGEVSMPERASGGWRERVELVARAQWTICRRHPWLPGVISFTRPMLAPNGMAHTEWTMQAMHEAGLGVSDSLYVAVAVSGYVNGVGASLQLETEAQQETGITSDEWMETQDDELIRLIGSGRFPMIAAIAAEPGFDLELDRLFELGLGLLLDGLDRLVSARSQSRT
jgi:DNA-binding transcriptional regulator YhcF (GntR family)/AcrR family transcriptional regulator